MQLVLFTPTYEVYSGLELVFLVIVSLGLGVCLLIYFFNKMFSKSIVKPVDDLTIKMKQFEKDRKHMDITSERKDEIGTLITSFSNMTFEVERLINTVYMEKIRRKNAQIKALQAQISPHFIYNTLENINWIAQINKIPQISDMVINLSELMEANAGKKSSVNSIRDELKYVEKYLAIVHHRYKDSMRFDFRIDEDCLEVKVPCLMMQPLVENAVSHGISKVKRTGIIRIIVKKANQLPDGSFDVVIRVVDNGAGIEPKRLNELRNKLSENYNTDDIDKSIGIVNTHKRVRLFCGEDKPCGITIESKEGCYTSVTCLIARMS